MSKFLDYPIGYLQVSDFNSDGKLTNPLIPNDKNVLIMVQGNFCGYCTQAKAAFQDLANEGKILCMTIQADGTEKGEKELGQMIPSIDKSFRGYPHYILYRNGNYVATHDGGRDKKSLEQFATR